MTLPIDRFEQPARAIAKHMWVLKESGVDKMWNDWKVKFLAALDDIAPLTEKRE